MAFFFKMCHFIQNVPFYSKCAIFSKNIPQLKQIWFFFHPEYGKFCISMGHFYLMGYILIKYGIFRLTMEFFHWTLWSKYPMTNPNIPWLIKISHIKSKYTVCNQNIPFKFKIFYIAKFGKWTASKVVLKWTTQNGNK